MIITPGKIYSSVGFNVDKYFGIYEGYVSSHDYEREDDNKFADLARKTKE